MPTTPEAAVTAGTIDWTCRACVYEGNPESVEDTINAFQADDAQDNAQAQVQWLTIEERAAGPGFHGQSGSLD